MRCLLPALCLFAAACRNQPAETQATPDSPVEAGAAIYSAGGRDRLCVGGPNGGTGFITFAATGDANCMVRGQQGRRGRVTEIVPAGDPACRIPVRQGPDGTITLGQGGAACAYYCGPKASFAGKSFTRTDKASPVTDLAGDPLC